MSESHWWYLFHKYSDELRLYNLFQNLPISNPGLKTVIFNFISWLNSSFLGIDFWVYFVIKDLSNITNVASELSEFFPVFTSIVYGSPNVIWYHRESVSPNSYRVILSLFYFFSVESSSIFFPHCIHVVPSRFSFTSFCVCESSLIRLRSSGNSVRKLWKPRGALWWSLICKWVEVTRVEFANSRPPPSLAILVHALNVQKFFPGRLLFGLPNRSQNMFQSICWD